MFVFKIEQLGMDKIYWYIDNSEPPEKKAKLKLSNK